MFSRSMKEAHQREVTFEEDWDLVTFQAFLKLMYCVDMKQIFKGLEATDESIDLMQLLSMGDMYQFRECFHHCTEVSASLSPANKS